MRWLGRCMAGVVILVGLAGAAIAATIPPSGAIPFTVLRNGDSPLGYHRVNFTRDGARTIVDVEIRFAVKLAFITAFRYEHTNREVWENGRLVALDTATNDDGKKHWVRGRATPDGFAVESSRGSVLAPADVIPTSYWNIATIGAKTLLDTQRGLLMDVRVEPKGIEPVTAGGRVIEARHFAINILTNKPGATDLIQIWFDDNDAWVKLAFAAKGDAISYVLDPAGEAPQQAALPDGD